MNSDWELMSGFFSFFFLKAFRLQSGPPTQGRDPSQTLQGADSLHPPWEDGLLPSQNILLFLLLVLQTSLIWTQMYVTNGFISFNIVQVNCLWFNLVDVSHDHVWLRESLLGNFGLFSLSFINNSIINNDSCETHTSIGRSVPEIYRRKKIFVPNKYGDISQLNTINP